MMGRRLIGCLPQTPRRIEQLIGFSVTQQYDVQEKHFICVEFGEILIWLA